MIVRFHATLRQVVGSRTVEVAHAAGMTVQGLLDELLARYPALRAQLVEEDGSLQRHVHVMVNGRDAPYLSDGLATELAPNANLDIFPPVGGGASNSGYSGQGPPSVRPVVSELEALKWTASRLSIGC